MHNLQPLVELVEILAGCVGTIWAAGATFSLRRWHRPKERPSGTQGSTPAKRSRKLSVTVSIGVSDSTDPELSPEQILKRADQALYRAKNKGRNQVSV